MIGAFALSALLGCTEESNFLPLASLCLALASDTCNARASCCGATDVSACRMDEVKRCDDLLAGYQREAGLRYDAVRAVTQREEARDALGMCDTLPNVAQFFAGGRADGARCERDAQCASGICQDAAGTCADLAPVAVCSDD